MIRLLFFIGLLFTSIGGYAQIEWDEEKQSARTEDIIEIDGVSKKELYERAKTWMARQLKSADNQVLYDDNYDKIIATGNIIIPNTKPTLTRTLNFKLSVYFKEGKCKIIGDNFIFSEQFSSVNGSRHLTISLDEEYKKIAESKNKKKKKGFIEIETAFSNLINNLILELKSGSSDESDDW